MTVDFGHDALGDVVYSDDDVLLLFGEDEAQLARVREAAARAGCRIAGEAPLDQAARRFEEQADVQAAIVVANAPSAALDQLLARIGIEARSRQIPSIIVAPSALIDNVAAHMFHTAIHPLIEPDLAQLQAAIADATAPAASMLQDAKATNGAAMLQQLSEEAARIAAALASLSEEDVALPRQPANGRGDDFAAADAGYVRSVIRARRLRDQYLRGGLFADPAFDMLLDLYAARLEGNRVAVSSLCIAAAVPATTALRWIKALTERGLFIRSADPQDGRRVYIELADEAAHAMGLYLAAVQRAGITAI